MAKPLYFSRWRRIIMQVVMCGVLAGSVGVAALVDSHLHHLQQWIVDGPVSFYVPSGWKISVPNDVAGSVHKAVEENSERTVVFRRQRIDQMMPPMQYLQLSGILEGMEEQQRDTEMIGDWPGQLVIGGSPQSKVIRIIACIILPTRDAITLELDQPVSVEVGESSLLQLLLKNMQINLPKPASGVVQFPGVTITLPGNFQIMPEPDPLYSQRHIFCQTTDGKYVTAELTAVLLPNEIPTESMQEILAGHELNNGIVEGFDWFNAKVTQEAPAHWRIDPSDSSNRRAYLVGQPGSQGVLISMRTTSSTGEGDLDALWSAISAGIHLNQTTDLKTLLAAGATMSHAVPQYTVTERHFIYTRNNVPEGHIDDTFDAAGNLPVREIYRRLWNGVVTHVTERWSIQPVPWTNVRRIDIPPGFTGILPPLVDSYMQVTNVINSSMTIQGPRQYQKQFPRPASFVLSAYLPDVLAKAPAGAMAIWTDRFVGDEGDFLLRPILLSVRRADGFVEVQVNGSGRLSRWYFAGNGTLEHADFPGGLTLRPATETEISAAFPGGRLTPTHEK